MVASSPASVVLVASDELKHYPISASERLDSHYFLQWNLKRWRASEWRKKVDPECGWYGLQLFFIAQDGSPIGTLPADDHQLAFDLNLPLEKFKALCRREVGPLSGWSQVMCDNGEVRLAHPVVTEVALEALSSKKRNSEAAAKRKLNKRLSDLRTMLEQIGASRLLAQPQFVERFNDWMEKHHAGAQRREPLVRDALDQFLVENGQ